MILPLTTEADSRLYSNLFKGIQISYELIKVIKFDGS